MFKTRRLLLNQIGVTTGQAEICHFSGLRLWKSQEMLRIAFREISGLAGFAETTRDITAVAEHCVSEVYSACFENLAKRWGSPKTGFGILAMGKFGGKELNYSSDIDVVFFYGEEGFLNPRFSYREFFTRMAEKIIQIFSATADPLFRIDVRLRPEGRQGPLVRSLVSMEDYYAGYGETWERMALIKSRGVAGDRSCSTSSTSDCSRLSFRGRFRLISWTRSRR